MQRTAITISEAIGVFERAFLTRNPNEIERQLRGMLNVQVAVVESAEEANRELANGKRLKTITVPFGVFRGKSGSIISNSKIGEDEDSGIYRLELSHILDLEESHKVLYPISSSTEILPGETYALRNTLAGYSPEKGLALPGEGGLTGFEPQPEAERIEKFGEGQFQTWRAHAEGVWERSERLVRIYRPFVDTWAKNALAPQWEGDDGQEKLTDFVNAVLWAMQIAVLLHDLGKLVGPWQEVVWENEKRIQGKEIGCGKHAEFIARTSPVPDEKFRKDIQKAPPHAPFVYPFLRAFLRNLLGDYRFLDAIALAAARHHSLEIAGVVRKGKFDLGPDAREFLKSWLHKILQVDEREERQRLLNALNEAIELTQAGSEADEPPSPSDDFYFLYCLANRLVKLCDWEDAGNRSIELQGLAEKRNASS